MGTDFSKYDLNFIAIISTKIFTYNAYSIVHQFGMCMSSLEDQEIFTLKLRPL